MFGYLLTTPAELLANSNVFMAFAFAVSIISLSYMAGEFMSMASLKGFAKAELYELGVSAVILVLLLVMITPDGPFDMVSRGFMPSVSPTGSGPELCEQWKEIHKPVVLDPLTGTWFAQNGNIAFGSANYFLGCKPKISNIIHAFSGWTDPSSGVPADIFPGVISSRLMKGYTSLMLTQMFTGFLSGLSTNIPLIFMGIPLEIGFMPFVGIGPVNQAHTGIVDLLGTVFAAFTAQNMLLTFIEEAAIPVFLPFGMILRAFPFSRKTGSTIIAVVVAAYFVYPLSILLNQQIWLMVVSPPCPAGFQCLAVGATCQNDEDCASFDCRAERCVVPLTDFTEYHSIYSLCKGTYTPSNSERTLSIIGMEQDKRMMEMYFSGTPTSVEPTKTEGRLHDGFLSLIERHGISALKFGTSFLFAPVGAAAQTAFSEIEVLVMDAGQYALLALIFTVLTVVISLTMLKDIAILIGGEPRVFGLSKLV
ncbi:MAG: hypothetical protein WCY41_01795 [Candidatus Micrarchaeia archaeon]